MRLYQNQYIQNEGFTLLEIIVVLIVVGIISIIVIGRASNMNQNQIGDIELIKSHIRYTQNRSMSDSTNNWGIVFSGSSYSLFRDANNDGTFTVAERQTFPGEDSEIVTLQSTLSNNSTIAFDWWGAPYTDAGCNTAMNSGALSFGSESITITPVTGFIP